MRIFTSADNRRAYRIKAVNNGLVLYDVAFNDAQPNDLDHKFGGDTGVTVYNRTRNLRDFSLALAAQGTYFGPGRKFLEEAGYRIQ